MLAAFQNVRFVVPVDYRKVINDDYQDVVYVKFVGDNEDKPWSRAEIIYPIDVPIKFPILLINPTDLNDNGDQQDNQSSNLHYENKGVPIQFSNDDNKKLVKLHKRFQETNSELEKRRPITSNYNYTTSVIFKYPHGPAGGMIKIQEINEFHKQYREMIAYSLLQDSNDSTQIPIPSSFKIVLSIINEIRRLNDICFKISQNKVGCISTCCLTDSLNVKFVTMSSLYFTLLPIIDAMDNYLFDKFLGKELVKKD